MIMKRFGLPKVCILKKNGEFNRVYRQGHRLHGKGFSLIFAVNQMEFNRLGISVQKKTGNAVHRNRIKRIIRETFRLHREKFPVKSDVVLTVRPDFSLRSSADVLLAVTGLMEKQGRVA